MYAKFFKRAIDVVLSGAAILLLSPLIVPVCIVLKCTGEHDILYGQRRIGFKNRHFKIWKFASMLRNSPNLPGGMHTTKGDPRVLPFGRFLRKTKLNELPQIFNIFLGDMSIVGPRPHMMLHTEMYGKLIDKYMVRHFCRPGITGWAQVTGFRGETKELWQMEERIRRDIWYLENWTFWLDLKIILKTALTIIRPDKKAY